MESINPIRIDPLGDDVRCGDRTVRAMKKKKEEKLRFQPAEFSSFDEKQQF